MKASIDIRRDAASWNGRDEREGCERRKEREHDGVNHILRVVRTSDPFGAMVSPEQFHRQARRRYESTEEGHRHQHNHCDQRNSHAYGPKTNREQRSGERDDW